MQECISNDIRVDYRYLPVCAKNGKVLLPCISESTVVLMINGLGLQDIYAEEKLVMMS